MRVKSPLTGKPMSKLKARSQIIYKGVSFNYVQEYYKCEESLEKFTTTELDEKNLNRFIEAYQEAINVSPARTRTVKQ